jgi:hypothetical protein
LLLIKVVLFKIFNIFMAAHQARVRYSYFSSPTSQGRVSAVQVVHAMGKSETSLLKMLTKRYPERFEIRLEEVAWRE